MKEGGGLNNAEACRCTARTAHHNDADDAPIGPQGRGGAVRTSNRSDSMQIWPVGTPYTYVCKQL